jgi:uncharacterized protein YebE (UPF0316 family)
MVLDLSADALLLAGLLFGLRILNTAIGTVRLVIVTRLIAYCAGFSVGNYVGMVIERRFITSFMTVNVICSVRGQEVASALREHGYGVTVTTGEGKDGTVTMLRSVINNRQVPHMVEVIRDTHAEAFVAVEEARAVHRGWIRAARHHH